MTMEVKHDPEADAVYITLTDGQVAETRTLRDSGPLINVDLDAEGNVLGVEVVA